METCQVIFVGLLFILLLCLTEIWTCTCIQRKRVPKTRTCKRSQSTEESIEEPEVPKGVEVPEEVVYMSAQSCVRRVRPSAPPIISSSPSPGSKFSTSACLRCGICLAIALRVNYTFNMASKNQWVKEKFDARYVSQLLESLCNYGFQNYELRKFEGNIMVMEALLQTEHVPTPMDGEWTKHLKSTCHLYIKEYGAMKLYNAWLYGSVFPAKDMVNALCRSGGIFRDCNNINDKEIIIPEYRKRWYMHCTVSARVPCV